VRLSVAIQAHPRRAAQAESLAALLAPLPVDIVYDPEPRNPLPSPWRTYARALDETPDWATHRLIIQDDATPCEGFADAAPLAVQSQPDACIAFFHAARPHENRHRIDRAIKEGNPLVQISIQKFAPVVALSWPADVICDCLCWTYDQGWPEEFRADDEIVGRALREHEVPVYATAPSLIQHEDVVPSLIRKPRYDHGGGRNLNRVAYRFLSPPSDAREIAWA